MSNIKLAHDRRRESCYPYKPIFGYKKVGEVMELNDAEVLCIIDRKKVFLEWEIARLYIDWFLQEKTVQGVLNKARDFFGECLGLGTRTGLRGWLVNPLLRGYLVYGRAGKSAYKYSSNWQFKGKLYPFLMNELEWLEVDSVFRYIKQNRYYSKDRTLPFGSLLRCNKCGGHAVGMINQNGSSGYVCIRARRYLCGNLKWLSHKKVLTKVNRLLARNGIAIADSLLVVRGESVEEQILIDSIAKGAGDIRFLKARLESLELERDDEYKYYEDLKKTSYTCFRDKYFWDWLVESATKSELAQIYGRFVKDIWFDDGQVTLVKSTFPRKSRSKTFVESRQNLFDRDK